MKRDGHEFAEMFIGTEVERSPAFGMKTLFVVGVHDGHDVLVAAHEHGCNHVYFGANHSFPRLDTNDADSWRRWEDMLRPSLVANLWVTLDLDVSCVEGLLESYLVEYDRFIPMISVKMPYLRQLGYNATVKLDDRDFDATNPGVWCHMLHDLTNHSAFTDWSKYTQDTVIKGKQ